jgi:K+-sensing histidine kinase KdpD
MKRIHKPSVILTVVFTYILLQFIWWEVLLVRQAGTIINERQKLTELTTTDESKLRSEIHQLHSRKRMQTIMIVGEGTVFLLLLLFGIYKIRQAQRREAEIGEQQKNFFLSITHELKTPIAATKLQLQTLQKQQLSPEVQKELIGNALHETERLNSLIDNVLLATGLESRELIFNMQRTDLSELIISIANKYYQKEISSGELDLGIAAGMYIMADRNALPSVIMNITDNAFKYSGATKKVHIEVSKKQQKAVLRISDHGIGIPDDEKKKIFSRFYRSGNEQTRRTKGTGLGLYIADYIVKRHNSFIIVKDNDPTGSIFEIEFDVA